MNTRVQVLDKGYVQLRNISGPTRRPDALFDAHDVDPAQAARMSFGQMDSARTYEQDMGLADYLMRNEHNSPFEMITVWFEMYVPIFVDRQFVRHRMSMAIRNESSGRYIELPQDYYIPKLEDLLFQMKDKKQGGRPIDLNDAEEVEVGRAFIEQLTTECESSYANYLAASAAGLAMEQARLLLHVNHYVHYVTKVDLRNLFAFLRLRAHSHAQKEAQAYAYAIIELLRPHLPGLITLFDKYMRKA